METADIYTYASVYAYVPGNVHRYMYSSGKTAFVQNKLLLGVGGAQGGQSRFALRPAWLEGAPSIAVCSAQKQSS